MILCIHLYRQAKSLLIFEFDCGTITQISNQLYNSRLDETGILHVHLIKLAELAPQNPSFHLCGFSVHFPACSLIEARDIEMKKKRFFRFKLWHYRQ